MFTVRAVADFPGSSSVRGNFLAVIFSPSALPIPPESVLQIRLSPFKFPLLTRQTSPPRQRIKPPQPATAFGTRRCSPVSQPSSPPALSPKTNPPPPPPPPPPPSSPTSELETETVAHAALLAVDRFSLLAAEAAKAAGEVSSHVAASSALLCCPPLLFFWFQPLRSSAQGRACPEILFGLLSHTLRDA